MVNKSVAYLLIILSFLTNHLYAGRVDSKGEHVNYLNRTQGRYQSKSHENIRKNINFGNEFSQLKKTQYSCAISFVYNGSQSGHTPSKL